METCTSFSKQRILYAELRNQISARRWKPIIALVLGDLRNTTLRNQISARRWKLLPAFCLRLLPSLRNQISARRWKQASVNVMFSCLLVKKPNLREEMETFTSGSSSAGTSSLRNQISARRWKLVALCLGELLLMVKKPNLREEMETDPGMPTSTCAPS